MIDGIFKRHIDPLWDGLATPLVRLGLTPNQVTLAGLGLILACCAAYALHRDPLVFALTLAVAFAFDALDGAVARRRDMRSRAGGYLDAVVDRYQELAVLATLGWLHGAWGLALFAFSGSVLTSYAKARTALEAPVGNEGWPDLFERLERIVFLCLALAAVGVAVRFGVGADQLVALALGVFGALAHATALQRARRAFALLRRADAGEGRGR